MAFQSVAIWWCHRSHVPTQTRPFGKSPTVPQLEWGCLQGTSRQQACCKPAHEISGPTQQMPGEGAGRGAGRALGVATDSRCSTCTSSSPHFSETRTLPTHLPCSTKELRAAGSAQKRCHSRWPSTSGACFFLPIRLAVNTSQRSQSVQPMQMEAHQSQPAQQPAAQQGTQLARLIQNACIHTGSSSNIWQTSQWLRKAGLGNLLFPMRPGSAKAFANSQSQLKNMLSDRFHQETSPFVCASLGPDGRGGHCHLRPALARTARHR